MMTISNTNYFGNIKNKNWGAVSHFVFSGSWDPLLPSQGEGYKAQRIQKWEKLEYWNTVKIIWYIFVIIFYKTFLIIKTK